MMPVRHWPSVLLQGVFVIVLVVLIWLAKVCDEVLP